MLNKINKDWPCVCGHTKAQHGNIRNYTIGYTFKDACTVESSNIDAARYVDNCESFLPINNLKYLESKL